MSDHISKEKIRPINMGIPPRIGTPFLCEALFPGKSRSLNLEANLINLGIKTTLIINVVSADKRIFVSKLNIMLFCKNNYFFNISLAQEARVYWPSTLTVFKFFRIPA